MIETSVAGTGGHKSTASERQVRAFLETIGFPWRIERGSKHQKVFVAEMFVGVLPNAHTDGGKNADHTIKLIKRRLRELGTVT